MADQAALQAAYVRKGFTAPAAETLANPQREGVDLATLGTYDDSFIRNLCSSIRKPGGVLPVRGHRRNDGADQLPNPGTYVSIKAELNLVLTGYMARHYMRTGRTLTTALIAQARIQG